MGKSLSEQIQDILRNDSLDYDTKFGMLAKLTTKHEAQFLMGNNPKEEIKLKEPIVHPTDGNLRTLYLVIERIYFDQILSGTKKEEYRELKDTTKGRYTYLDTTDGKRYLKPYDAILLCVGYHKNRATTLVEVTDIVCDGDIVTYRLGNILRR